MATNSKDTGKEIEPRSLDATDLRTIASFEDALRTLQTSGVVVELARDAIGVGFFPVPDKSTLVNRQFLIVEYSEHDGDMGPFCFVRGVTVDGQKFQFTDGSTGVYRQLHDAKEAGTTVVGLNCQDGLTKSEYDASDSEGSPLLNERGQQVRGTTFYIAE